MELILTSIVAFASTNIDDLFLLMLFFANKSYRPRQIFVGQYLGILAICAVSLVGSLIGLLVDQKYIGLLGLLPIYFGIKNLIEIRRREKLTIATSAVGSNKTISIAAITLANGGDNIGIYIPLFNTVSLVDRSLMIAIFLIMVAVWCFAAKWLSQHTVVARSIDRFGHILMPIVLILLGVYILVESDSFKLLMSRG